MWDFWAGRDLCAQQPGERPDHGGRNVGHRWRGSGNGFRMYVIGISSALLIIVMQFVMHKIAYFAKNGVQRPDQHDGYEQGGRGGDH